MDETPLSELHFFEFIELVAKQDLRPARPDYEDAPQLSDKIWALSEQCWAKDPKHRPTASTICGTISDLLDAAHVTASFTHLPSQRDQPVSYAPAVQPISQGSLNLSSKLLLRGHSDAVTCAPFSLDGEYIISGSTDHTVIVWDAQTGDVTLGPLNGHADIIYCVAFSHNGMRIASGSGDTTLQVCDTGTRKAIARPFRGHTNAISSISFSPNGKRIASGSTDKTIWIWDAKKGDLLVGPMMGHTNHVTSITFSGNGNLIASRSFDTTLRVWDVMSGRLVQGPLRGHNFMAFSSGSKRIISFSQGGNACVWDIDTGVLVSQSSWQHAEGILAVVFTPNSTLCAVSPDGKWLVGYPLSYTSKPQVQVWDSKTGLLAGAFEVHTHHIQTVTFSPDSK